MKRLLLLLLLSGCTILLPPSPYPPSVPTATPVPVETPAPKPAEPSKLTSGRAVFELDLSRFVLEEGLDTYAAGTLCWEDPEAPVRPEKRPETPCLQIGVRGYKPEPCLTKPCNGRLAVEARWSANLRHDGQTHDEAAMCGEGNRPPQWIPLGAELRVLVTVEWGPGFVRVSTPAGSWTAQQGADGPGFGYWVEGIPKGGIGWSYLEAWTFQAHGGKARLVAWEPVGEQPELGFCP